MERRSRFAIVYHWEAAIGTYGAITSIAFGYSRNAEICRVYIALYVCVLAVLGGLRAGAFLDVHAHSKSSCFVALR